MAGLPKKASKKASVPTSLAGDESKKWCDQKAFELIAEADNKPLRKVKNDFYRGQHSCAVSRLDQDWESLEGDASDKHEMLSVEDLSTSIFDEPYEDLKDIGLPDYKSMTFDDCTEELLALLGNGTEGFAVLAGKKVSVRRLQQLAKRQIERILQGDMFADFVVQGGGEI